MSRYQKVNDLARHIVACYVNHVTEGKITHMLTDMGTADITGFCKETGKKRKYIDSAEFLDVSLTLRLENNAPGSDVSLASHLKGDAPSPEARSSYRYDLVRYTRDGTTLIYVLARNQRKILVANPQVNPTIILPDEGLISLFMEAHSNVHEMLTRMREEDRTIQCALGTRGYAIKPQNVHEMTQKTREDIGL